MAWRIEPWRFAKTPVFGVREQSFNVTIALTDTPIAPASALFRHGGGYAVYIVKNDRTELSPVELERTNGVEVSVNTGLEPRDQVVLYPSPGLSVGDKVRE